MRYTRALRLLVVIVSMTILAACYVPPSLPEGQAQATTAVKTPKPTFTPVTRVEATAQPEATATKKAQEPTRTAEATSQPTSQPAGSDATATAVPEPTEEPTAKPTEQPASTSVPKSLTMDSPEYGMQAFVWWRPEVSSRDMQAIRDAGFGWVKVNFGWRDIEGAGRGIYDWSRTDRIVEQATDTGLDLLVRVDHQPSWAGGGFPLNGPPDNLPDLVSFWKALATRYKGRVRAYEVWNEPNLGKEWGGRVPDPTAYAELLRVSYAAIKAADPNAMVISAGLSPTEMWNDQSSDPALIARPDIWYLESMYIVMGGSSNGYFDVLGVHGAGFDNPPEVAPSEVAAREGRYAYECFRHVEDYRAVMVKQGDSRKQIGRASCRERV